jgi:alanine dehydrogenase
MSPTSELLKQLAREVAMAPQEQLMEVGRRKKSLFIGIPRRSPSRNTAFPLTPAAVAVLVGRDHEVVIERGAGQPAQFQDSDYSEAGAMVVDSAPKLRSSRPT